MSSKWDHALDQATGSRSSSPEAVVYQQPVQACAPPRVNKWRPIRSLILNFLSLGGLVIMGVSAKAGVWQTMFLGMFMMGAAHIADSETRRPGEGMAVGVWIVNTLAWVTTIALMIGAANSTRKEPSRHHTKYR